MLFRAANTILLILLTNFIGSTIHAQEGPLNVTNQIFSRFDQPEPIKRPIMDMSRYSGIQKANPFIYLSAGILFFYQRMISEQIQAECNYRYSCSTFMKMSIARHGFVKGSLMGMDQWNTCLPSMVLDHAAYTRKERKILNDTE